MGGLTLKNNAFVVVSCANTETIVDSVEEQQFNLNNILAIGEKNYTMEIVFDYNTSTTGVNRGLIGTGKYSEYFSDDNWGSPLTNITKKKKFEMAQNEYYKKFGYAPFIDENGVDFNKKDFSGQTNALKINSAGDGLLSTYNNGNDLNTGTILSNGTHTATVVYDGINTKIYLDGKHVTSSDSKPDAQNIHDVEFTVGATNRVIEVSLYTNGSILSRGRISYTFTYEEFLNDTVYSVRIYDRALNEKEIQHNYEIDFERFISQ